MDKLITTPLGGWPLELDDIRWMEAGFTDALLGLAKAFGDNFILQGCEATNTGGFLWDITPGWVVLDGEICYWPGVVGQTIPDITTTWFTTDISFDATGFETMEDGTTANTYQKRRARIVASLPTPALLVQGARMEDQIFNMLGLSGGTWTNFGVLSNSWSTSGVSTYQASYRLEPGGLLRLRGWLDGSASTGTLVITLPSPCHPAKDVFSGLMSALSPGEIALFQLTAAGALHITTQGAVGVSDKYDLSQVPAISLR